MTRQFVQLSETRLYHVMIRGNERKHFHSMLSQHSKFAPMYDLRPAK
jgi:hypothetical protein